MKSLPLYRKNHNLSKRWHQLPAELLKHVDTKGVPYQEEVLQRHVGIEIECEKCGDTAFRLSRWQVERDGSLRGEDAYEFKTMFPSTCYDSLLALQEFFSRVEHLRKAGRAMFDFSERTSIHVHIDVRDLTEEQIKSMVKLYMIYEKSLFDLVGRERRHNIFCIPLCESNLLNGGRLGSWWQHWEKYSACNLHPLANFGTVEFRIMAGNDNLDLISTWVLMLCALAEYAAHNSPEVVDETINTLKTESQYQMLADNIFGCNLSRLLTIFPEASDSAASLTKLL